MKSKIQKKSGFTLIEIMIVVVVIGVVAAIAIPSFNRYIVHARATAFARDIVSLANAANQYSLESGNWFPSTSNGDYPEELRGYFSEQKFELGTSLGGVWDFADWEEDEIGFDYTSAVGVEEASYGSEIFTVVDRVIDDGNLGSGTFRGSGQTFYFIFEE